MTTRRYKTTVILVLLLVIFAGVTWRVAQRERTPAGAGRNVGTLPAPGTDEANGTKLPMLLEFGAGRCKQCKAMKPIIEALATEYRGRVNVQSIDVVEQADVANRFGVWGIPAQVFLDEDGNEAYRHEGFMPKADIIAKFEEMGVQ